MNKTALIIVLIVSLFTLSCSKKDSDSEYPKTVNIKFDVTTSRNTEAIISTTLNNETETENVDSLPFSITYAQTEVDEGTYLKLSYKEDGIYTSGTGGIDTWTDYTAELKIYVDNQVVKTQSFEISENVGLIQVDYTFQ